MKPIKGHDIGKGLGILAHFYLTEAHIHADISAWSAPGECHDDARKGEASRLREAWRRVKAATGLKKRAFIRECHRRTGNDKAYYLATQGALLRGSHLSNCYPLLFGGWG